MRPATSCAITTGGTRRSYSRSFRRMSRCASESATFPSVAPRWSFAMAEANSSVTTAARIARWVRALRGVAWTRHLVAAQALEQEELRRAIDNLERSQVDMVAQTTARFDSGAQQ